MTIEIPAHHVSVAIKIRPLVGNLYGYVTIGAYDVPEILDAQTMAGFVATAWKENLGPLLCHDCEMGEYVGTSQVGDSNPTFTGGTMEQGGGNFESVPPSVCALVRKNTDVLGRQGRGRMYLPWFIDETNVGEAGDISSTTTSALQSALNAFYADCEAADCDLEIMHPTTANLTHPTKITSFTVESVVATQRRRQRR